MGYLSCPLCDRIEFSDVQELQQHIACALTKCLSCPICSATLKGLHSMHVHLANHIPIDGYEDLDKNLVPSSPDQFPALETLDIQDDPNSPKESQSSPSLGLYDSSDKAGGATYNCNQCGLVFASDHFLTLHKDLVHIHACSYEVTCKQCKSRFKSLELYRDHVREKHSDRRYICDQCPKSFKWKGGLVVHNRMCHDQNSSTMCYGCTKKFSSKYRRDIHVKKCALVKKAKLEGSKMFSISPECLNYDEDEEDTQNLMQQSPSCSSQPTSFSDIETISSQVNELEDVSKSMTLDQSLSSENNHSIFYTQQNAGRQVSPPPVLVQDSIPEEIIESSFIHKENIDVEMQDPLITDVRNESFTPTTLDDGQSSSPFSLDNDSPQSSSQEQLNIDLPSPKGSEINKETYYEPSRSEEILNVCDKLNQRHNILQNLKALSNLEYDDFIKATLQSSLSNKNHLNFNYIPLLMEGKQHEQEKTDDLCSSSPHIDFLKHIQLPEEVSPNPSTSLLPEPEETVLNAPITKETPNDLQTHANVFHKMEETIGKLSYENSDLNEPEASTNIIKDDKFTAITPSSSYSTTKALPAKAPSSGRSTGTKSWECDECKKCFTTKYFLKKHKRLHTGETPYSCEECGKTYTFQQSFHKHLFYHSSDKPHICPHCGRAFKEMSTLHNHIRIHTGEKPFTCTTCGKYGNDDFTI